MALAKFNVVRVDPAVLVQTSLIPAISMTFLDVSPAAMPRPRGAWNENYLTLPDSPVTS